MYRKVNTYVACRRCRTRLLATRLRTVVCGNWRCPEWWRSTQVLDENDRIKELPRCLLKTICSILWHIVSLRPCHRQRKRLIWKPDIHQQVCQPKWKVVDRTWWTNANLGQQVKTSVVDVVDAWNSSFSWSTIYSCWYLQTHVNVLNARVGCVFRNSAF